MVEFSPMGRQDASALPPTKTPVIPFTSQSNVVEACQSAMGVATTLSDISMLLYLAMQARRKRTEDDFPALSEFFRKVE